MSDFEEYIRQCEPGKKEKGIIWQTAIGLQQVDGLKPSAYLIETAKQNIEGDITFDEVKNRIDAYYKTLPNRQTDTDDRTEEADKVSARIAEILSEKTFSFSPAEFLNIHRRLFHGLYKFAGKIRDYKGLTQQQIIEHIAHFIAYLWQIHIFGEGNTRTTAVFLIKYLRKLGFNDIGNDLFAQHSWYFRNALVRANYKNLKNNVYATNKYLERFLENLLLGENHILKNRELHINYVAPENTPNLLNKIGGVNDTDNVADVTDNVTDVTDNISVNVPVNDKKFHVNDEKFPEKVEKFPVKDKEANGGQKTVVRKSGQKGGFGGQKKWSENLVKVFELIRNNPKITRKELAETLQINPSAVQKHIEKLKEKGIISRVGSDKAGSWKISDKGGENE